ncbi:MAG: hypothetical protein ACYC7D_13850 [Nitrososphaerales archaeon]
MTTSRTVRSTLLVTFVALIILGLGLYLFPRTQLQTLTYDYQAPSWRSEYPDAISGSQLIQNSTPVLQGYWVQVSIQTSHITTLTMWINQSLATHLTTVFNVTGQSFSADFPILENGSLAILLANSQPRLDSVNGSIVVYSQALENITNNVASYPHRNLGIGLTVVGGAGLFLFAWNPKKIATRGINYLLKPRRKKEVSSKSSSRTSSDSE